jgi:pyruvate/2-oxoglutarate dehydrogenase complex dihydrolipoamide acyltransferase (E2) component
MGRQLLGENQQLKNRMQNLDKGYLTEYGTRLDSEVINAKRLYKEAYEAGDADKMMEAQEAMSKMSIEQERLRIAKQRSEQVEVEQGQAQGQPAPQQAAQQQAPAPKPDPKAEAWAEKNEWFGSDEVMTYAAFGIHRKLVEEEGIDPSAEEYYTEVDRRMRVEFPHKFQAKKSGGAQVAPAGASATRSTAKTGRRSVKLSPSQIAMAKRLNVPLEEYAKYVKE